MKVPVIYTEDIQGSLQKLRAEMHPDLTFILCDHHTQQHCLPLLGLADANVINIECGDGNKTLATLSMVWESLSQGGATRHSLLINLGGGMVTDLGGFAAATFKRGIRFVNVPTTLLAMVDAAVGGKTGINFGGLKNEVGCFRDADEVVIHTPFLRTLDTQNLRAGYAEMLKHALITGHEMWADHLLFNLAGPDLQALQEMVRQSIEVKQRIVNEDPHERGLRKALNLGHTVGHALESMALSQKKTPLLHGYAVAYGLIAELYLSTAVAGFPSEALHQTTRFIRDYYGRPDIGCKDYDALFAFMQHDKKNQGKDILFTLLADTGQPLINKIVSRDLINEALDFLRDG